MLAKTFPLSAEKQHVGVHKYITLKFEPWRLSQPFLMLTTLINAGPLKARVCVRVVSYGGWSISLSDCQLVGVKRNVNQLTISSHRGAVENHPPCYVKLTLPIHRTDTYVQRSECLGNIPLKMSEYGHSQHRYSEWVVHIHPRVTGDGLWNCGPEEPGVCMCVFLDRDSG